MAKKEKTRAIKPDKMMLLYLIPLFLFFSCSPREESIKTVKEFEIIKQYSAGPVVFFVRIDKKEISVAENLHLELQIDFDENYQAELPEFDQKLGQFTITDFTPLQKGLQAPGKVRLKKTYQLSPFLGGDYLIPGLQIRYYLPEQDSVLVQSLQSEEIQIRVKSVLSPDDPGTAIKDIAPPLAPPRFSRLWLLVLSVLIALIGLAGVIFYLIYRKKQKQKAASPGLPAHQIALDQLSALAARRLVEQGQYKLYYFEINRILRYYIENRFHLKAPGQTTEEFLEQMRMNQTLFTDTQKERLRQFLSHCDLVKFANHKPSPPEIQAIFSSCRDFIIATQEQLQPDRARGGASRHA